MRAYLFRISERAVERETEREPIKRKSWYTDLGFFYKEEGIDTVRR
jgi:hypothetical protein